MLRFLIMQYISVGYMAIFSIFIWSMNNLSIILDFQSCVLYFISVWDSLLPSEQEKVGL